MPGRSAHAAVLLALAGAAALACAPLLIAGLPPSGHDAPFHVLVFDHFSDQLRSGEPYPRWLADINAGYGAPVFFYYPPLPYYAATLVSLITVWTADPWLELGIATWLAVALSGLTFYGWIRSHTSRRAALAGSIVYMVAPYHLAIDVYLRSAYAEVWAFVWPPLLLCGVRLHRTAPAMALTAAAVALLLMTHLPTALLFAPFAAAYALFLGWRRRSIRPPLRAAAAAALGACMAAIYIAPALLLRDAALMELLTSGPLQFDRWFFFAAPESTYKNQLAFMATTMLAVLLAGEMIARRSDDADASVRRFWVGAGLIAFALMTAYSRFVWIAVPPLQQVQFPWRLGTVMTLATAAVTALVITRATSRRSDIPAVLRLVLLPGIALAWLAFSIFVVRPRPMEAWVRHTFDAGMAPTEYRTRGSDMLWRTRTRDGRTLIPDAPTATLAHGSGAVAVLDWRPRHIRLRTTAAGPLTLEVRQQFFPGWSAEASGVPLHTRPGPLGLVWIDVPPGSHTIHLRLAATPAEANGARTSATAVLVWLAFALAAARRDRRGRRQDAVLPQAPEPGALTAQSPRRII